MLACQFVGSRKKFIFSVASGLNGSLMRPSSDAELKHPIERFGSLIPKARTRYKSGLMTADGEDSML